MRKTFKYRIYANKATIQKALEIFELCRILYNLCLEQRRNAWKYYHKPISLYEQGRQTTELKKAFPEFKRIPSQAAGNVLRQLDRAFQAFYRRVKRGEKPGYPRFKGVGRFNSLTLENQCGWRLKGNKLIIPKIGTFKVKLHRPIEGTIKTVTITKTLTNKWFVCFSCDNIPQKLLPKTNKSIGIDVGCESFLTTSDGTKIANPRFLTQSEEKLKRHQRALSRKKKGSNRRKKAKLLLAKTHEKIANQRQDFQFKVANLLVKNYNTIYIEDLKSWKSWRSMNKSMRDASWFQFFGILLFKAAEAGREVIKVPARGTSQLCSNCGKEVPKDLSVRIHNCPYCHLVIDRDVNAALNILRLGTSLQGSLCFSHPEKSH